MESKRQQKFARLIQKDLSDIFQREIPGMLEGAFLTITGVRISPDLSIARVYCSILAHKAPDALVKILNENIPSIRKMLGVRIRNQARIIPNLVFFLDTTGEEASYLDNLISGLNIPPSPKDNQD